MSEQSYEKEFMPLRPRQRYPGIERLISAALADQALAAQLVVDAGAALEQVQPILQLSPVERSLVMSIAGAADIYDFASRLHARLQHVGAVKHNVQHHDGSAIECDQLDPLPG